MPSITACVSLRQPASACVRPRKPKSQSRRSNASTHCTRLITGLWVLYQLASNHRDRRRAGLDIRWRKVVSTHINQSQTKHKHHIDQRRIDSKVTSSTKTTFKETQRMVASNHIHQNLSTMVATVSFLVHLVNTVYLLFIRPVQNNKDTVGRYCYC